MSGFIKKSYSISTFQPSVRQPFAGLLPWSVFFLLLFCCFNTGQAQIVPARFANNPTDVEWTQTETNHFKIVFPRRHALALLDIAPQAENIYQEYKRRLGLAPNEKITLYYNDFDEVVSGVHAQNIGDKFSIWTGDPFTPSDYPGEYTLHKALRAEIAYAFLESVQSFPVNYWYYIFSRPSKSPWSNGAISFLVFPEETPGDISNMRYYEYLKRNNASYVSPAEFAIRLNGGRSQIHYFEQTFSDSAFSNVYTSRRSLFGWISYFDFNPAFRDVTEMTYDDFTERWQAHLKEQDEKMRSASSANMDMPQDSLLNPRDVISYRGAAVNSDGNYLATIALPDDGSYRQDLRVTAFDEAGHRLHTKTISRGIFDSQMSWNADASALLFARRTYISTTGVYHSQLYGWSRGEGSIRKVTDQPGTSLPTFAPDGHHFAYAQKKSSQTVIWLGDIDDGSKRVIHSFGASKSITDIHYHPEKEQLLVSFMEAGNYKLGIIDGASKTFTPFSLQASTPLNVRWSADGRHIYLNKMRNDVPNIFEAEISGNALHSLEPVTNAFYGATLWDVTTGAKSGSRLLAQTGTRLAWYSDQPMDTTTGPITLKVDAPSVHFGADSNSTENGVQPDVTLNHYNAFYNLQWEPPFVVPYYITSGDFGLGAYAKMSEPMRIHQFNFTGLLSLSDPWGKSFFYSSYVNNSLKPRIELDFNRRSAASGFFKTSQKTQRNTVLAGSALWKLSSPDNDITSWYGGLMLRYMAFEYFPEPVLNRHHPGLYFSNHKTEQTDMRAILAWRRLDPGRHTLIHPLIGTGVRLSVTGSDKILGSQTRYARFKLDGYHIFPSFGQHRIYFYGAAAADIGEPAGRDYLGFSENGNYRLPGPDFMGSVNPGEKAFVRGYSEPLLGDRFLFGSLEYRIPFQFDTDQKLFGLIPPARTSFVVFADGGVMDNARISATDTEMRYRYSAGLEAKHIVGFGENFKLTCEGGIAQPLDKSFGPTLYVNLKSAIPF